MALLPTDGCGLVHRPASNEACVLNVGALPDEREGEPEHGVTCPVDGLACRECVEGGLCEAEQEDRDE